MAERDLELELISLKKVLKSFNDRGDALMHQMKDRSLALKAIKNDGEALEIIHQLLGDIFLASYFIEITTGFKFFERSAKATFDFCEDILEGGKEQYQVKKLDGVEELDSLINLKNNIKKRLKRIEEKFETFDKRSNL